MKKGDIFPTGFGVCEIVDIRGDIVYAVKQGTFYYDIKDFNVLQFTRHEVENYIKYQ